MKARISSLILNVSLDLLPELCKREEDVVFPRVEATPDIVCDCFSICSLKIPPSAVINFSASSMALKLICPLSAAL